jgi:hypothetical protein
MSVVRPVSRLIVLSSFVLLIGSCAQSNPDPNLIRPFGGNPCAGGAPPAANKQAPIVCIDDSARTLVAKPDRIHVHESKKENRSQPVQIQWYTTSGTGDVHVKMEPGCTAVKLKTCNGNGNCQAETTPGVTTQCKYDVWITGGKHDLLDPDVVIDPCC